MLTRARTLFATLRSETGIALPAMMSIMLVLGILTAGVLVTVQADTPLARRDQDRKLAYGAAEAGIQNYLFRLQHDLDLWTQCDQISGTKFVNPAWNGSGTDPRVFRTLPGTEAQYTVELLPATGYTQCSTSNPSVSLVQNGLIRIRSTGKVRGIKRSLIAKFRRRSFLDFLYFTDIESLDPAWYTRYVSGAPTIPDITQWASDNCGWYRDGRSGKTYSGKWYDSGNVGHNFTQKCGEIQFAAGDTLDGPVHTNDEFLVCGHPTFGRTIDDSVEVSASSPGWRSACSNSSPTFKGTYNASAPILTMPPTNTQLRDTTDPAYIFTGKTTIVLGASNMTVNGTTMAYPANGQIYIQNGTCGQSLKTYDPYNSPAGCADVYVRGSYGASLTIASQKDIIINGNITNANDSLVALIADQFIRIYHPITNLDTNNDTCDNVTSGAAGAVSLSNPTIVASLFALNHSFMVDNYFCGNPLGTLSVTGTIVQKYRGPVGTGGSSGASTGYIKDYNYDDRFHFREPPAVVDPIQSSWRVLTQTEQVTAR